jgi:hypothetical protein
MSEPVMGVASPRKHSTLGEESLVELLPAVAIMLNDGLIGNY